MYGDSSRPRVSNHSSKFSCSIEPAKGLNHSLPLTVFTKSLPLGSVGSYRIERLPSARGPASERPWNKATMFLSAISFATSAAFTSLVSTSPKSYSSFRSGPR